MDFQIYQNFVCFLSGLLVALGGQHGFQNLPKSLPKSMKSNKNGLPDHSKFCMYFEWPFGGSWGQHGTKILPKWCPGGEEIAPCFWAWRGLGRVLGGSGGLLGPLGAQKPILSIFDRFFIDLYRFF